MLREHNTRDLREAIFRETGRLYGNMIIPRLVITPQTILGKHIPAGTLIACSPLATSRDPNLFPDPEKFRPERWLLPSGALDEAKVKGVQRTGESTQFGRGPHACV